MEEGEEESDETEHSGTREHGPQNHLTGQRGGHGKNKADGRRRKCGWDIIYERVTHTHTHTHTHSNILQ